MSRHLVGAKTWPALKNDMGAIHWPTEQIRQPIAAELPGFSVEIVSKIDSTNSELMRRARAGRLESVLLVAEQQTAGRGRLGRQWFSHTDANDEAPGVSLTFSIGLTIRPRDWSGLSLALGVSVVESLHPDLRLKWPNDVWWQERKLAGILIETANVNDNRYAVVGIGINIKKPATNDFGTPVAWLNELMPDVNAAQALLRIAAPVTCAMKAFQIGGFAPFHSRFQRRDALAGRSVALSDGTIGVALGTDEFGVLRVQTEHELKKIVSSEVSLRLLPQASGASPLAVIKDKRWSC
jgi:BirA family biotin operon repressor/biotin-[acetyl-CoA-carboxylase] ligase